MADGKDEEEARKEMRNATARLFEKRSMNSEGVHETESARISVPLPHKWQTIIDDTIIPHMSKHHDHSAVRKRSQSITPDENRGRPSRPLSMPSVASPIPPELSDVDDVNTAEAVDRERKTRPPARLQPLGATEPEAPPPSYLEATRMDHPLPRTLPFYGRLWQRSRQWNKEAQEKASMRNDILDNGIKGTSFTSTQPLPPIVTGEHVPDGDDVMRETTFTNLEEVPSRRTSYTEAVASREPTRDVLDIEEGRTEERKSPECNNWFGERFPRVVRYLQSLTFNKLVILTVAVVVIIGLVIFLGVFPASFVYVEYHEMALLKNKVTGSVNRDEVYLTGCYVLGPDKEFIRYPIHANIISQTTTVFTVDRLEIDISFHLQYYIRSTELGDLHREYEKDYNSVIEKVMVSEIKNNVGRFNLDYFRLSRPNLEKFILNLLQKRLEGDCCQTCCPSNCNNNTACATCLPPQSCHPGYHVDIKYFQLTEIDIPRDVSDLYVQKLVHQVNAEKEFLLQDYAVVKKETLRKTQALRNDAKETLEEAQAIAAKTLSLAEADKEANITSAYVSGLKFLYLKLGVNDEQHKLSLMMMRALEDANVKGNLFRGYGYNVSTIASHAGV